MKEIGERGVAGKEVGVNGTRVASGWTRTTLGAIDFAAPPRLLAGDSKFESEGETLTMRGEGDWEAGEIELGIAR